MCTFIFNKRLSRAFLLAALVVMLCATTSCAQTSTFTYQGRLTDGGTAANGNYDLQFALFDSAAGGTQIGVTQTVPTVSVSGGIFTVTLDFGASAFPNANRFLEISVRPAGGGTFTTLSPRQQISSTPYAIRTLNAGTADGLSNACVACVQDAQINSLSGSKVSGPIPVASVPAGSANYIQNSALTQQAGDFNITGAGNIGGNLSAGGNLFVFGGGLNQIAGPLSAPLKVQSTTSNYGLIHTDGNVQVGTWVGQGATGKPGGWFGTRSNDYLHFFTADGPARMTITTLGNVGIGTTEPIIVSVDGALVTTLEVNGGMVLRRPSVGGDKQLCWSSVNGIITTCASSLRYKKQIVPLRSGLDIVNRLRPVTFAWKDGGIKDLGLIAEEVAQVEPMLVTHDAKGQIEGVRYDHLTAVLINAIKEQQSEIEQQQVKAKQQQVKAKQQQNQIETSRAQNAALNARLRAVERTLRKRASSARRRR